MKQEPRTEADWAALAQTTVATYNAVGATFDHNRSRRLFEKGWLDRFFAALPGPRVLDLGCGAGEPVARYLIEQGSRLTGLDASDTLLAIARQRFPTCKWHEGDMRDFDLGDKFDGVIAWNSFFHLSREGQVQTLAAVSHHLMPGGSFLTTVGPGSGPAFGHVGGEMVYHYSMAIADYRARLAEVGMHVVDFVPEDPDCAGHSVLLMRKFD